MVQPPPLPVLPPIRVGFDDDDDVEDFLRGRGRIPRPRIERDDDDDVDERLVKGLATQRGILSQRSQSFAESPHPITPGLTSEIPGSISRQRIQSLIPKR